MKILLDNLLTQFTNTYIYAASDSPSSENILYFIKLH